MESVDPKLRRPYRVEFGIYVQLPVPMSAYTWHCWHIPAALMKHRELMGHDMIATMLQLLLHLEIVSFKNMIQAATLTWNATLGQWDGAYAPETGFGFAQELNVGGIIHIWCFYWWMETY